MSVRTFGAIGDIHGEDRFLAAALDRLDELGVDVRFAVGDVVDGRGDVDRCCTLLDARNVLTVRGNHERWLLEGKMRDLPQATDADALSEKSLRWIAGLPPARYFDTAAGRLILCHGVGTHDMVQLHAHDEGYALTSNRALQEVIDLGFDLMVSGHTHRPMVRQIAGLTVINAGTLHYADAPCFVHVDLEKKIARYFEIDDEARVHEGIAIPFGRPGQDVWGAGF